MREFVHPCGEFGVHHKARPISALSPGSPACSACSIAGRVTCSAEVRTTVTHTKSYFRFAVKNKKSRKWMCIISLKLIEDHCIP